jgi:uncharacterized protein YciI
MRKLVILSLFMLPFVSNAQATPTNGPLNHKKNVADTAKKPKYEMKQYYFVMLSKGTRRHEITDTAIINKLQAGHMANITRLAEMGKILVAGPFGDDGNWRGIFIFDAASKEEVEGYLKEDPAIAAGRLAYEIRPWWTAKNAVFK